MEVSHVAVVAVKEAMELSQVTSWTPTVTSYRDFNNVCSRMTFMYLSELHLIIDESSPESAADLARFYESASRCRLDHHDLQALSITYKCNNKSDDHNGARYMIIMKILRSLNWDQCRKVDVNLQINFVCDDVRMQILQGLPINVSVAGSVGCEDDYPCESTKLKVLSKVYPYLEGCF